MDRKEYSNLKESNIIGDYLLCFHNFNNFKKITESLETHLKENQELKDSITQNSSEIKTEMNKNFEVHSSKIDKIQEKIEKNEENILVKFGQKIVMLEEKIGKVEEKIGKVDKIEQKIDFMIENYIKIQNLLMESNIKIKQKEDNLI